MKLKSKADGFEFEAYHVAPKDARRGGLVLIQEIFGVTRGVRELADGFAEDGYEVLAPQMFDRAERDYESERTPESFVKGREYLTQVGFDNALGDVQACIDALLGPVFVTGFCYGGTVTWLAAARCAGLKAAACFYGGGISGLVADTPKVPTILHFGKQDELIPPHDVDAIRELHPDIPVHLYEAGHAFVAPSAYHADSATLAMLRTRAFFHRSSGTKEAGA
jgi:carboxymethylenebutenolidase